MNLIRKIRYNLTLEKIARLEHNQHFISEFFCGETNYPIEKAKNERQLLAAKKKLRALK